MEISRRNALKFGGVTAVGAVALGVPLGRGAQTKGTPSRLSAANFPRPYSNVITKTPAATPRMVNGVAFYDFAMKRNPAAQVLNGPLKTPVFGYNGIFPGPRIELNRGTPAVVRVRNHLPSVGPFGSPAQTSTHLHGSASLPEFDGYANDTTKVGDYKDYKYPNFQPSRTLWYHDHGVHWTAQQAYGGLAAMYVIHDKQEQTLLPSGQFDIPLLVNDALFGEDGQLLFENNSGSGLWGDVILVNGRPWPVMKVQRRTYRFRLLNSSISRSYTWRLSNGMPLQVVATDGGIMPKGVAVTSMRHGGAERYEVVIDFSKAPASTRRIELLNDSNENNIDFPPVRSEVMSLPVTGSYERRHFRLKRDDATGEFKSTKGPGIRSSPATSLPSWPTRRSATPRSGSSRTVQVVGLTRFISTSSNSGSSTAPTGSAGCCRTSRDPRTSCMSVRARR